jgi:hypothetical protein
MTNVCADRTGFNRSQHRDERRGLTISSDTDTVQYSVGGAPAAAAAAAAAAGKTDNNATTIRADLDRRGR